MSAAPFIVPTLTPSGALHFAAVKQNAVAQDIIDALSVLDEVKDDILGDLEDAGWAIQKIRNGVAQAPSGNMPNGLLDARQDISSVIGSTKPPSLQRHFSAFPLSSHLHTASIRLVSLHGLLRVTLYSARIPDLDDDVEVEWFLARTTSVGEVLNGLLEELDLTKVISGPGGGNVDYVLEEVWISGQGDEVITRLSDGSNMSQIVLNPVRNCPFSAKEKPRRVIRFCVPDEWYRRSKSRSLSLTPIEDDETALASSSESGEEGGTAKQRPKGLDSSTARREKQEARQSGRFSFLEGWGTVSSPSISPALAHATPGDRGSISVSAPVAVLEPQNTGLGVQFSQDIDLSEEVVNAEFERMMDELGLKNDKREAMRAMPLERKQYLVLQSRQSRSIMGTTTPQKFSRSPEVTTANPLSPQSTGGIMKRFSIWGSSSGSPGVPSPNISDQDQKDAPPEALPIVPQITGSLWGNWWAASPKEQDTAKEPDRSKPNSTEWFVDGIKNGKITDDRLAKHLISLRVHLSTAKVAWIERFLGKERGMDALAALLQSLVGKGGKRKKLSDREDLILLEVVKCLRILLNTAPGYPYVLQSPNMITHITFTLYGAGPKLRALSSDLLAAICVISLTEGHRLVLGALSDYRICFEEAFRFEHLIDALRIEDNISEQDLVEDGIWEARGATMGLIIALTSCSESLEERVQLREEFSRRGLNEMMVALRYLKPPDSLLKQLDAYAEDKYEDEEDLREQTRLQSSGLPGNNADATQDASAVEIVRLKTSFPEGSALIASTITSLGQLLDQPAPSTMKQDILFIFNSFIQNAATLDGFDEQWANFMIKFGDAIQPIVPTPFPDTLYSDRQQSSIEIESSQDHLRILSDTVDQLRVELAGQTAELNSLRALAPTLSQSGSSAKPAGKVGGNTDVRSLVTRLIQKERQVAQLQKDVEILREKGGGSSVTPEEEAKRERERAKLKKSSEEIAALKLKVAELEQLLNAKGKDVIYLKRALESVYSRFHGNTAQAGSETSTATDTELDVESMANHTIEGLHKKDGEILQLREEVTALKAQLSKMSETPLDQTALEKQFKSRVAPPPPPPPPAKPKRAMSNTQTTQPSLGTALPLADEASTANVQTPALPPVPPPPPAAPASQARAQAGRGGLLASIQGAGIHMLNKTPKEGQTDSPSRVEGETPPPIAAGPPPPPPPPPPPSLPGASPPPPPPPPGSHGGVPSRRPTMIKAPSKKLKPFFWNKLNPLQVQSTVWSDVNSSTITLNMEEVEKIFLVDNGVNSKAGKPAKEASKSLALTTLLDITRANNIAIMLARIKFSNADIKRALLELDDTRLSTDDLKAIARQLPTNDEISRIRDFGDLSKLSRSDQYFGEVMGIGRLTERLDSMLYRRRLELDLAEVRPDLDTVRNAGAEIKASVRLKGVLGAALALGNALNGGTFRGGARGFQLDALLKMRETKTANGDSSCPTLLHYLAKIFMQTDSSLVMFIEDLPHVEAAARVSVQFVTTTVNSLCQGMERAKQEVNILRESTTDPLDLFCVKMGPFIRKMEPAVQSLRLSGQALDTELRDLLSYFGEATEGPEATKPEDFFNLIVSFSTALQKAALETHDATPNGRAPTVVVSIDEDDDEGTNTLKGQSTPRITPSSSQNHLSPPDSHGRASGNTIVGRGDVDQAIRSIRDGQRRARPSRPLSKMFLDGSGPSVGMRPASRAYD